MVTAGRAVYLLGDRRYELTRNTLVWLFPGQDHILLAESADYEMWIGVFKPSLLAQVCRTPQTALLREADPPGRFCRRLFDARCARLDALFQEVDSQEDMALFNAGLGYALLSAWQAYQEAEESAGGPDVHPAVRASGPPASG